MKCHAAVVPNAEFLMQVTGFGYDHDEVWAANIELFKDFTDLSRGVRRLGAAAVDLCHVGLGALVILLCLQQYRLLDISNVRLHMLTQSWCCSWCCSSKQARSVAWLAEATASALSAF